MVDELSRLTDFIKGLGPPAVAFSGGVDSSLVAAAAYDAHGRDAVAVTVVSELLPGGEEKEAAAVAAYIGIRHVKLRLSVLDKAQVADNPKDRCYHCKLEVFSRIAGLAGREGLSVILDGTNADDAGEYRPGLKALGELGVKSPLAELGFTKDLVRKLARERGLPSAARPSAPCLATRFPYGVRLSVEGIRRVGEAEGYIRSLGFDVVRVRDHGTVARVELARETLPGLVSGGACEKIVDKLKSLGYNYVAVDLEGYKSGSMDIRKKGG